MRNAGLGSEISPNFSKVNIDELENLGEVSVERSPDLLGMTDKSPIYPSGTQTVSNIESKYLKPDYYSGMQRKQPNTEHRKAGDQAAVELPYGGADISNS